MDLKQDIRVIYLKIYKATLYLVDICARSEMKVLRKI